MRFLIILPLAALLALSACGTNQQLPANLAAQSDGANISKGEVKMWMAAFAQTPGQPLRRIPDAPSFRKCAQGIANAPDAPKTFRARQKACAKGYRTLQDKAMTWLLNQVEITRKARELGLYRSTALQSQKTIIRLKRQKGFDQELKDAALTEEMAYQRILINRLAQAITNKAKNSARRASPGEIKAYLIENKQADNRDNIAAARKEIYRNNQQKAVRGTFKKMTKRLRAETVCAKQYKIDLCGQTN